MTGTILRTAWVLAALVLSIGCAERSRDPGQTTIVLEVSGMTCGGCEAAIRSAVSKLAGVREVRASHREHRAWVTLDNGTTRPGQIVDAIDALGYKATVVTK